jgi:hypothetical protein
MVGGLNVSEFQRGIRDPRNIAALQELSKQPGWWQDVLHDPSLLVGIRNEYLNIYWQGQSIFKVTFKDGQVLASTHPKYLLNPDLSGQIPLRLDQFEVGSAEGFITRTYKGSETLGKLKRAAGLFSGEEKQGVHRIATSNLNVVDVEIALPANGVADVGSLPRVDLATFENSDRVELIFWEAKTFANPEIRRAERDASDDVGASQSKKKYVADQIAKYQKVIRLHQPQIAESYAFVADNLVDIAEMSGGQRKVSDGIVRVANEPKLLAVSESNVGLIVYGYDKDQSDGRLKRLRSRLEKELVELGLNKDRLKFRGDAKGLTL